MLSAQVSRYQQDGGAAPQDRRRCMSGNGMGGDVPQPLRLSEALAGARGSRRQSGPDSRQVLWLAADDYVTMSETFGPSVDAGFAAGEQRCILRTSVRERPHRGSNYELAMSLIRGGSPYCRMHDVGTAGTGPSLEAAR